MEHFFISNKSNQLVTRLNWTNPSRGAGVDQIPFFEGEELRYVGDNGGKIKEHEARVSFLLDFSIDLEVEVDVF